MDTMSKLRPCKLSIILRDNIGQDVQFKFSYKMCGNNVDIFVVGCPPNQLIGCFDLNRLRCLKLINMFFFTE